MFSKLYTFTTSKSFYLTLLSCCLFLVLTSFNTYDSKTNHNTNVQEEDCNLTLTVENQGECPLYLYEWLSSGDVFETIIQAGDSYSVETYENAMWRVTNGDFNNLVYDENIIATICPEETWVTYPVYCHPPMTSWDFDCNSGKKVEIVGEGIKNDVPHTLNFDNSSNIYKTVVEVVYKGGNPGSQLVIFDNEGNPFSAYREAVPGSSSNVWVYRATMPGAASASIYNTTNQNKAQSMVAYLFRENVPSTEQTGVFTYLSGYNSLETLTFDIPTASDSRDIVLTVPISELTDDGRYLMLEANAGGVSNQTFVYGPSSTLGCCLDLVEVVLNNVPASANQVTLNIDTRHNQNGQSVNGQSYVLAGAVEVDGECTTPPPPGETSCELNDHGTDGSTSGSRLLWIKLPGESTPISRYSVVNNNSSIIEYADGTALISGVAGNIDDPSFQWEYSVKLINKRSWAEWSALGRDYKAGVAGSDHTTWTYYEVDNSNSYFTGLGGNAGESLTITHNPGDYEFGFQIGTGANVKNAAYGLSGWFKISGSYTGHGDFNGNLDNCGDPGICADGSTPEINAPADITVECTDSIDPADIGEATLNCVSVASFPIVEWDLDACTSYSSNGTNLNFSEFTPTYPTTLSCGNVSATNVTRNYGQGHSCTYPRAGEGGEAMCVSAKNSSSFNNNDDKAIRFSVTLDPTETTHLTGLKFWELAPFEFSWIDGPSGPNNYPKKYGIRVLKDGTEIFKEIDIPATNTWTLETIDFSGNDDFKVTSTSTFSFELLGYDLVGNGANVAAWDIDDVQIEGGCSSSSLNSNITYTDVESGDCPKVITRTFEYTYETNTNSSSCEDENIVRYTMDECHDDGNYNSLGEFHATYPNNGGLSNVSATGFSSGEDAHSCTPGPQGVSGMCIPAHPTCTFGNNDDDILMFSVSLSPQNGDTGKISKLEFFEKAPLYAEYTYSNNNPLNNYPTKYGVRILKNGTEIFTSYGNPTTLDWTLETFDFSNDPDFSFTSNTTFEFHLIGYCTVGNGGSAQAWDLDDLKITGGNCTTTTNTNTQTITAVQTITVEDNNAPTFTNLPADLTVNCEDDPAVIAPDFSDACDDDLDVVYEEEIQQGNCDDNYSILRKWTATDDCGNSTTATQLVTFSDTTDPVFSNLPDNMIAECDAVPVPVTLTATDNCDADVSVSFVETRIDGTCEDNYQLERIWTATDNCGNTFSHTQIITVSDLTSPVFEPLADVTLECSDDLTAPNPVANDNCDTDVHIVLSDEFTSAGSCTDNYTITRIWTATDNCGNQSTLTQVVTVQDSQAPTIVVPSDETVSCDAIPEIPTPTVNDNCDNDVSVNFNEAFVPGSCDNSFTLIRTWVAEDNCGNSATATQIVTVTDTTSPELTGVPADETTECDAIPAPANPSASDNCDNDVNIEYQEISTQDN